MWGVGEKEKAEGKRGRSGERGTVITDPEGLYRGGNLKCVWKV